MVDQVPGFPRELDAERVRLSAWFARTCRPLWGGSRLAAPRVAGVPSLWEALGAAARVGQVTIGLEAATVALDREARGLAIAHRRAGAKGQPRVSRLLLTAADGAERFYREVERVVGRHADRVLACVVDAPALELGTAVVGRPSRVKAVLVTHKHAVAMVLRALAADG